MVPADSSDLPDTLDAMWRRAVLARSEARFLSFQGPEGDVSDWTYREFDGVVAHMVSLLDGHGIGSGGMVHLALGNSPVFVAVWLAAARIGASIVPSDPMATAAELAEHQIRTGARLGFASTARQSTYERAIAQVVEQGGAPLAMLVVDEFDSGFSVLTAFHGRTDGPEQPPAVPAVPPGPLDRAAVMFTSGTTGRPKGVEITQANYAFAGSTMAAASGLEPQDRQLVVLPLFHANAQYYSFAAAIAVGASVAMVHSFSASGFLDQAARHGATHASLFAGPMRMILARGRPLAPGTSPPLQLRHCWFAQNVSEEQYETLSSWLGCRPRQLYGMTETIPAVLTDRYAEPRCDLMGDPTPGCQVELHDANGRRVGSGEVGEIMVAGRRGIELFAGYLEDPETTKASFVTREAVEWFATGDRAARSADGRFRFDGRRSDVLKVSGENVSVVEVETVIAAHPRVHEVCVVGRPDPIRDEVPVAFVVASLANTLQDDALVFELAAWCEERLAKAKRPRSFTLVEELPRTSVGKIRKFMLNEEDQP